MKVTRKNSRVIGHGKDFVIAVFTDQLGNYIHSRKFKIIQTAIDYHNALLGFDICANNVKVQSEQGYFRIFVKIKNNEGDMTEEFHSRRLNLIDVQFERNILIEDD